MNELMLTKVLAFAALGLVLGVLCVSLLLLWQIVLLYGGVIALQVYFLQDVIRQLCALYACGKEGGGHDR